MSIKVSTEGKLRIRQAQKERGWPQDDDRWLMAAAMILDPSWTEAREIYPNGCSLPTWRRFFQGKPINAESFKAFCSVLQVDWEAVIDRVLPAPAPPPLPSDSADSISTLATLGLRHSWGEAPDVSYVYGRETELGILQRWVLDPDCRLVMVLGMGGIGKTTTATKLARRVEANFDCIIWRSLLNAPPVGDVLADWLQVLAGDHYGNRDIAALLDQLRRSRCLLIVDNAESILQGGEQSGIYRPGYEGYGELFQRMADTAHQSCLLLTSREKPDHLVTLEGDHLHVRSLRLSGLPQDAGCQILSALLIQGTPADQQELIHRYSGNPQALKLVAASIRELFHGSIHDFLQQGITFFSDIRTPLEEQFNRLSAIERQVMYWLAINREPVTPENLATDLLPAVSKLALLEALRSLARCCLIDEVPQERDLQRSGALFTQQPVVMEYVTDRLIEQVIQELTQGNLALFNSHALIKAQAKDYVRDSQVRLILAPIATHLQAHCQTRDRLETILGEVLTTLRHQAPGDYGNPYSGGYGGGNLLNLCRHLQVDLTSYNCSYLTIRQAYLSDVNLHNVNFSHADLSQSVFAQNLGGFLTVAISPDGQWLATGDNNSEVLLWKLPNGTQQFACKLHTGWLYTLTFSADSRLLATGGDDQTLRVWDVETGQCLHSIRNEQGAIYAAAFCPGTIVLEGQALAAGDVLAIGGDDQTISLWHIPTGTCVAQWYGHDNRILTLAFSPDGQYLVSGDAEQIMVWDVHQATIGQTINATTNRSWAIAFTHPTPALLSTVDIPWQITAAGSDNQAITLWDVLTGQRLHVLTGHQDLVQAITFSPDGSLLASSSTDQTIKLWDVASQRCLKTFGEPSHGVWSLSFSPDQQWLVSGGDDQMVKLWDVASGWCLRTVQGHTRRIWSFALSHDHQVLATGSDDYTVRLWNVATGQCLRTLAGHTDWVWAVTFGLDDRLLASGSDDNTICLWDAQSGQHLRTLRGHHDRVHAVAFRPTPSSLGQAQEDMDQGELALLAGLQRHILASGSSDCTIHLWDVATGDCIAVLKGHSNRIWALAFNRTGQYLASGSYDHTIRLWDVDSGDCLALLRGHHDRVHALVFCPVPIHLPAQENLGDILASAGDDLTVRLWDIATGQCIQELSGHSQRICSLAFSPDGATLVTGSDDQTIRLWDVFTGQCLQILRGHSNRVWFTNLTASGQFLISGSHDGTVKLWAVNTGKCLKTLAPGKPYEGMNIYNTTGLTPAQRSTLRTLGAIETLAV